MIEAAIRIAVSDPVESVTGLIQVPTEARAILVLAHGAGAGMNHPHMNNLASGLLKQGIACFRFNFPFIEKGSRRADSLPVAIDCSRSAINTAISYQPDLPLFIGGHSFGGRIATHVAVDPPEQVRGLIAYSFPLHPAKKPSVQRAEHLTRVSLPMLFINGERDRLAETELLNATQQSLPQLKTHWLKGADHSYKTTKSSATTTAQTYLDAAAASNQFINEH